MRLDGDPEQDLCVPPHDSLRLSFKETIDMKRHMLRGKGRKFSVIGQARSSAAKGGKKRSMTRGKTRTATRG